MRKGFASLAVIGIVAAIAVYSLSSVGPSINFTVESDRTFVNWVAKHGKQYLTKEEYLLRKALFELRLAMIEENNAQTNQTWFMKLNAFADMTQEELD